MKILAILLFLLLQQSLVPQSQTPEAAIKAVLDKQVSAWNRGDLTTFVTTYEDDCLFVGNPVLQGRAQLLARYRKRYPTPEAMGHLTFSRLAVHPIDNDVAIVTADWHLDRSKAAGGPVGGYFSLVFHRQHAAWRIAMDHTTAVP